MGAGKGDAPRPLSVPATTFADRWAQTFGVVEDGIVYERRACDHADRTWLTDTPEWHCFTCGARGPVAA